MPADSATSIPDPMPPSISTITPIAASTETPTQTSPNLVTEDIACSTDASAHHGDHTSVLLVETVAAVLGVDPASLDYPLASQSQTSSALEAEADDSCSYDFGHVATVSPATAKKTAAKNKPQRRDRKVAADYPQTSIQHGGNHHDDGCHKGIYVDATFGRGGHSRLLLAQLAPEARLIVFDKDPSAIATAHAMAEKDARLTVVHDSFANLHVQLAAQDIHQVDGIMADLGVSSPQLDEAQRGFSFMRDGAVDMRMDTSRGQSVGEWLAQVDETTLADVLYEYGEERHSRRIARAIKAMPSYDSTLALAEVIKSAHPNWQKGKHPATQSFQAMRIFINNELGDLDALLQQSLSLLRPQGWVAVISFHSLEDRRIKQFFQRHSRGQYPEDEHLPMPPKRPKYFEKPIRIAPNSAEIAANPRARSAWLRAARRTQTPYDAI